MSGWFRLPKPPAESDVEVDRRHRAGEYSEDARSECHDIDVVLQALSLQPKATLIRTGWTVEVSICEVGRATILMCDVDVRPYAESDNGSINDAASDDLEQVSLIDDDVFLAVAMRITLDRLNIDVNKAVNPGVLANMLLDVVKADKKRSPSKW
jgi:hypothetical protein